MGKERGMAALGAARLAFEQRDMPLGCSMLAEARRSATAADVELRNQIEAYGTSRCTGQSATTAVASSPPAGAAPVAPASAPVVPRSMPVDTPPARAKVAAQPKATPPISTMQPPSTPKPSTPKPSAPPPRSTTATVPAAHASPGSTTVPRATTSYTVQLAAYDTRPPAEALVAKLETRGVKARVSGTSKPFRVRLDFYRTHQEAADVVSALKKRGMVGFVTTEARSQETSSP